MEQLLTKRPLWLFLVVILSVTNLLAKENTTVSPWFHNMEFSAHHGYIWVHTPSIAHLQNKDINLFHLSLAHQTNGNKVWHQLYNFPEVGVGILFGKLGNPEVVGHTISLAPHVSLPLFRGKTMELFIRHDVGIAYLTKCFHSSLDNTNNAIGSHINISVSSRIQTRFQLGNNSKLSAGLGIVHFSNGGVRKPNLGINIPVAMISYTHDIAPSPEKTEHPPPINRTGSTSFSFSLAGGLSRINPSNNTPYPAFSLAATLSHAVSEKRSIGLGTDLFLNYADKETMRIKDDQKASLADIIKPGIHLSYEQAFGSMDFIFQNGVYLLEKHRKKDSLYTRLGFRYHTSQNVNLHLCLNSNRITASFIEIGMGFRIK